jgi:hypothetical protein
MCVKDGNLDELGRHEDALVLLQSRELLVGHIGKGVEILVPQQRAVGHVPQRCVLAIAAHGEHD